MSTADMLDALDLAMSMRGVPLENIRMPVEGTFRELPYAGMATKEIDFPANRAALWEFFQDSFVVVEDDEE